MKRNLILSIVIILIVGAIFLIQSRKIDSRGDTDIIRESEIKTEIERGSTPTPEGIEEKVKKYERAKEISTPDGFINADADFNITDLIGEKVILLDIWTYSCINCQRTLPYLNNWHKKYEDQGLVIIGLHTPEFEFEKDYDNVLRATEKFGIKYPVVLDNDYSTWTAYKNRYWPRKYLIDIDGFIVYDHIGEGGYSDTEEKIVELLNERREVLSMGGEEIPLTIQVPEGVQVVDSSQVRSRETYLGWGRSEFLANLPQGDCRDKSCTYVLPQEIGLGSYVLGGDWVFEKESVVLESETGVIGIAFSASKVNLVVDTADGATAEIWLDGKKIRDIKFGDADLYNIVDLEGEYGEHILEIRIKGKGFSAFAFTFG
jgi:thiol-disulfide isomerase/thioredoxin